MGYELKRTYVDVIVAIIVSSFGIIIFWPILQHSFFTMFFFYEIFSILTRNTIFTEYIPFPVLQ